MRSERNHCNEEYCNTLRISEVMFIVHLVSISSGGFSPIVKGKKKDDNIANFARL